MPHYTNLSVGKISKGGKHTIYTVEEGKETVDALITFISASHEDLIVSVFRGEYLDGEFISKPGYGDNATYHGLEGLTLAAGETISIQYTGESAMRYTLVGHEESA